MGAYILNSHDMVALAFVLEEPESFISDFFLQERRGRMSHEHYHALISQLKEVKALIQ